MIEVRITKEYTTPAGIGVSRLDMLREMHISLRSLKPSILAYFAPSAMRRKVIAISLFSVVTVTASAILAGCNRASAGTVAVPNPREVESARQQMELIPPPSKNRFMAVHSLSSWENPYLTVQANMVTLHVTMGDANTSGLGVGGMLRPVAAREQVVSLASDRLPDALTAVPENSWPYGRVVAIEEAHDTPASARPMVRRNMEAAIKTLNDLGVVAYEWSENGVGVLR